MVFSIFMLLVGCANESNGDDVSDHESTNDPNNGSVIPNDSTREFEINGIYWMILQDNRPVQNTTITNGAGQIVTSDGTGTVLIVTRDVHGGGQAFNESGYFDAINNTTLRSGLNSWWNDNVVSTELAGMARGATGANLDVRTSAVLGGNWTPWTEWAGEDEVLGVTTPANEAVANASALFVLSVSEANRYFGNSGIGNNAARVANGYGTDTPISWWLRSPGDAAVNPVAAVDFLGTVTTKGPNAVSVGDVSTGFRPALWISS